MFKEILRVKPQMENADLNNMERTLNSRFKRVAKSFGSGLASVIKGGLIVGAVTSLIDKVLNPLQEVKEAIDKSLARGDDLVTFAKQFHTTEGNLAMLQAFGKASGLEAEGVRLLLGKFQSAVAESAGDPSKPSAVKEFVKYKDTAEGFFAFIQSLKKLGVTDPNAATRIENAVFGEKQLLKASEFIGQDFEKLKNTFEQVGIPSTGNITAAAQATGQRADNRDLYNAVLDLNDIVQKGKLISDNTIEGLRQKDLLEQQIENQNLGKFQTINAISIENQKLANIALKAYLGLAPLLTKILPKLVNLGDFVTTDIRDLKGKRGVRGVKKDKD